MAALIHKRFYNFKNNFTEMDSNWKCKFQINSNKIQSDMN